MGAVHAGNKDTTVVVGLNNRCRIDCRPASENKLCVISEIWYSGERPIEMVRSGEIGMLIAVSGRVSAANVQG